MKKKIVKNCKPTISDRCGTIVNLICTQYEGELPEGSQYDEDSCITGEEIIEDIITILDEHTDKLDYSDFDTGCLEIEPEDEEVGLTPKEVDAAIIAELCDIKERLKEDCPGKCEDCGDGCEEDTGCCKVLEYYDSSVTQVTVPASQTTFVNNYPTIKHKTLKGGQYKVTVDLDTDIPGTVGSSMVVGISQDSIVPATNLFEQQEIRVNTYQHTLHFTVKTAPKTELAVVFKDGTGTDITVKNIKVLIEKV